MATLNFPSDPSTQNPVNTYSPDSTPLASENGVTYLWDGEKWTASTSGAGDIYVNVDGDTMTGNLTVPSLNGGPLAGLRNQIINGDFRVWQRGTSFSLTGEEFTADRWLQRTTSGQVFQTTDAPQGFRYSLASQNETDSFNLYQGVELVDVGQPGQFYSGSQWTLSFWAYSNQAASLEAHVAFSDKSQFDNPEAVYDSSATALTGTWTKYTHTFTINKAPAASNTCLSVNVRSTGPITTGFVRITGIQLEPGPVATPFEMRPIGMELQLCQRYYQRANEFCQFFNSIGSSNAPFANKINFKQTLRATPNIVTSNFVGTATNVTSQGEDENGFNPFGTPNVNTGEGSYCSFTYTADAEL